MSRVKAQAKAIDRSILLQSITFGTLLVLEFTTMLVG